MNWFAFFLFLPSSYSQTEVVQIVQPKFISAVQILVREEDDNLFRRSRRLIENSFNKRLSTLPTRTKVNYETTELGSELDFLFFSEENLNQEIDQLIQLVRRDIEGKVKSRGRALYFQTAWAKPNQPFLKTSFDRTSKKIIKLNAQGVSLLELLQQIPNQKHASYSLTGDCSDIRINFNFENPRGKSFEQIMEEMGKKNNFKMTKTDGTYYFSRENEETEEALFASLPYPTVRIRPRAISAKPYPVNAKLDTQEVFLPLPPLSE